ncbi:MAG: hypothetical protein WBV94_15105, partial [Blastocatellia bacterium]
TGLVVSPDARHRAMPCAIEFRPFRADYYVEFTLKQIIFDGEPFTAPSLQKMRDTLIIFSK